MGFSIHGILLRDYKSHSSLRYFDFKESLDSIVVISGDNGIGKSSILESIDVFFGNRPWILRKGGKRQEAVICPVFSFEKNETPQGIKSSDWDKIDELNEEIDNLKASKLRGGTRDLLDAVSKVDHAERKVLLIPYQPFWKKREFSKTNGELKTADDDPYSNGASGIDALDKLLQKIDANYDWTSLFERVREAIISETSYLYYPVQARIEEVTRLHAHEMTCLTGESLTCKVDELLKVKSDSGESLFNQLKIHLKGYLDRINESVQESNQEYEYKTKQGVSGELSVKGLRNAIISAYFETRTLKKGVIELIDLSSGQQRQVLLDLVYAFLKVSPERSKNIIVAIDEPEASLHAARAIGEFQRILKLSRQFSIQTILTTHWYGFLPLSVSGTWIHMYRDDNGVLEVNSYDLSVAVEKRGNFPDDVEVKSIFDLVSAIAIAVRVIGQSWIICEGYDDYRYLTRFFRDQVEEGKLKILAVGGSTVVIEIFKHLRHAVSKKTTSGAGLGKVFCLIDTDLKRLPWEGKSGIKSDPVSIRRIQSNSNEISLICLEAGGDYSSTEIEDVLCPQDLLRAMKNIEFQDEELNHLIEMADPSSAPITGETGYTSGDIRFLGDLDITVNQQKRL